MPSEPLNLCLHFRATSNAVHNAANADYNRNPVMLQRSQKIRKQHKRIQNSTRV